MREAASPPLRCWNTGRELLDPGEHPRLSSGATTVGAWPTATQFVTDYGRHLGAGHAGTTRGRTDCQYDDARARLIDAGVAVRPEPEAREAFLRLHSAWEAHEHRLLHHFRYDR